jgi:hypothetical protein
MAFFVLGVVLGVVIWIVPHVMLNLREAWDRLDYYLLALFAAGFACGTVMPKPAWVGPLGMLLGQAVYVVVALEPGPFGPLGATEK